MIHRLPWILALMLIALFEPTASIAAEDVPVHQCDRLAAHRADYQRAAPPVEDSAFLPKQAAVACRDAVAAYPDAPRFRFQLGRALLALEKIDEAKEVLQGAADGRYAVASLYLARIYVSGSHGERDREKAFEYVQLAAEQGHQDAQIWLGSIYRDGTGVEIDPRQAFRWFQEAAAQNNPRAHFLVGSMYATGEHGVYDPVLAFEHFKAAADGGVPAAHAMLGHAYLLGHGVEKDSAKGLELMEAAVAQGYILAAVLLGDFYMSGEHLPQDREQAIRWFCTAGDVGREFFLKTYNEPITCNEWP